MVELLSAHAIDVRHLRKGHNHALPSNPGTQWVVVSAGIAQERVVMARSQMPDDANLQARRTFSGSTFCNSKCPNDLCNEPRGVVSRTMYYNYKLAYFDRLNLLLSDGLRHESGRGAGLSQGCGTRTFLFLPQAS